MNYPILERYDIASYADVRAELSRLNDALLEDELTRPQAVVMVDMVALFAAELAATFNYTELGDVRLPLSVTPNVFRMSVLKGDTLPTRHCRTPARIEAGEVDLTDLFLFTADLDKFLKIFGQDLRLANLHENFRKRIEQYVENVTETSVSSRLEIDSSHGKSYLFLSAIFWRLRLNILLQNEDEHANEADVVNLIQRWNVSGVAADAM